MVGLFRGSFWHCRGYVIIKIKGARLESFVNKAVAAGVTLHDTERLSAQIMVARVSVSAFRKLRGLCRSGHWRISVLRRIGAPFLLFRMARRKGLVAGGLAGLLLLYLLSSVVWFVEVKGAEQVPRDRILALAAANGLKPGALKGAFAGDVVERQLLLTLDKLSWAYVETRGTLAVIHVAEKVIPDPELTAPGDIVAAFDGVIEDIIVMRGVPTVQEGDIVRAGQVLISGLIPLTNPLHAEKMANGEAPYIKAEGVLRARVWHEGYAEAALVHREEEFTGNRARQIHLTCGNRQWLGGKAPAYASSTKNERVYRPGLGPWRLPISIAVINYKETNVTTTPIAEDEALAQATAAAWEQVRATLPQGAVLQTPAQVEVDHTEVGGLLLVRVHVTQETVEDIRKFRPIEVDYGPGAYRPTLGPLLKQPVPGP